MGRPYARIISLAGVFAAALFAVASGGPAATASTTPATTMVRVPMQVVGFDAKVAAAHGYALRKEANGATELVNVRTGSVVPQNVLGGNCGYSWYFLNKRTAKTWTFNTGFHIDTLKYGAAVDFTWHTHVAGPAGYSKTDNFGGALALRATWQSRNKRFHSYGRRGTYHGVVTSGHAVTVLGAVCYTAHPSATLVH